MYENHSALDCGAQSMQKPQFSKSQAAAQTAQFPPTATGFLWLWHAGP